jgi:tRNA pseudouridine55 synthase
MSELNGVLLVDKPQDLTSHDVVHQVKKHFQLKYVGHAGTLDPLATGLMVVLLGEATKLSNYLLEGDKAYECEIELGKTTDTLDITGEILRVDQKLIPFDLLKEKIEALEGAFQWDIPMYSAKKVNGKKLYELAREDKELDVIPQKEMRFYNVQILSYDFPFVKVSLHCSKGSFIRSWAHELGKALGVGACLSGLRRIYSAPYNIHHAVSLSSLTSTTAAYIPLEKCLDTWPKLEVRGLDKHLITNGQISQALKARLKIVHHYNENAQPLRFRIESKANKLLAIVEAEANANYRLLRVFRA